MQSQKATFCPHHVDPELPYCYLHHQLVSLGDVALLHHLDASSLYSLFRDNRNCIWKNGHQGHLGSLDEIQISQVHRAFDPIDGRCYPHQPSLTCPFHVSLQKAAAAVAAAELYFIGSLIICCTIVVPSLHPSLNTSSCSVTLYLPSSLIYDGPLLSSITFVISSVFGA